MEMIKLKYQFKIQFTNRKLINIISKSKIEWHYLGVILNNIVADDCVSMKLLVLLKNKFLNS